MKEMSRFSPLLRPRMIVVHVITVILVVVMANLSLWQFHRLDEKKAFNSEVRGRAAAAPAPLTDFLVEPPDDAQWYRVVVTGTFRPGDEVTVLNRSQDSTAGLDVVTPLDFSVNGKAYVLLVDRGFVPLSATFPSAPSGEVEFLARIRKSQERRLGALSDPASGRLSEVQRVDVGRLAAQMKSDASQTVLPYYVDWLEYADGVQVSGTLPSRVADPELSNGPHLSYAIQWILFSCCAIAAWFILARRAIRSRPSA